MMAAVTGYWPFGLALCAIWQIADVTCCTSSIMHMCTISLDRYAALRRPLVARCRRASVAGVWARVAFIWALSFGVSSPLIVVGLRRPAALLSDDRQCFIGYAPFLAYGSLVAFFCPLAVMLVTYALTTRLLRRRAVQAERLSREGSLRRTTSQRRHRRHDNSRLTVRLSASQNIAPVSELSAIRFANLCRRKKENLQQQSWIVTSFSLHTASGLMWPLWDTLPTNAFGP